LKKIVLEDGFDFEQLAKYTDGYSNSDLKELCRNAVMVPVRESIRKVAKQNIPKSEMKSLKVRPVSMSDFLEFTDSLYSTTTTLVPVTEPLD
jgi:SpoVK/Ycf46/Vps4 family AAA+-type ATPase